jgi:hypothetical protein
VTYVSPHLCACACITTSQLPCPCFINRVLGSLIERLRPAVRYVAIDRQGTQEPRTAKMHGFICLTTSSERLRRRGCCEPSLRLFMEGESTPFVVLCSSLSITLPSSQTRRAMRCTHYGCNMAPALWLVIAALESWWEALVCSRSLPLSTISSSNRGASAGAEHGCAMHKWISHEAFGTGKLSRKEHAVSILPRLVPRCGSRLQDDLAYTQGRRPRT